MTKPTNQPAAELWDREPDPCWSCGGRAEARDDIHVRCIDSNNIDCEVMNHWYTRKTWNTRHQPPAVPLDGERTNLARQIQQMYRERSQPLMTHEPPFESLLGLIVDAALTTTPAASGPRDADAITHAANLLFNGTTLECDGNELRSDGTCAKCERVNQRIMAKFSPVAIELLNETFPETTNAATGAQTCVDCAAGIPKNGGYLHDLTPQLANDETHTYRKCANAPAKAELTAAPTSGAIAAAKEWFQETRQAIEYERPRTSESFTEAATANLDAAEQKLAAIISRHLPPEAPSISAAIAEVERLRDEWREYCTVANPIYGSSKIDAANAILERLRALQPSTPSELVDQAEK